MDCEIERNGVWKLRTLKGRLLMIWEGIIRVAEIERRKGPFPGK